MNGINPTLPLSQQLVLINTTQAGVKLNLVPGQLLEASVLSNANGQARLQIGQAILEAHTTLALLSGQKLTLRVERTEGQVLLQLTEKSFNAAVLAQGLRQTLPRQLPVSELLNKLDQLFKPQATPPWPAPLRALARQLLERLPLAAQLQSPQGLKQALQQSGLFLENRLRQSSQNSGPDPASLPSSDFKAALLQLRQMVRMQLNAHPDVARSLDGQALRQHLPAVDRILRAINEGPQAPLPRLIDETPSPQLRQRLTQLQQLIGLQLKPTDPSASAMANPGNDAKTLTLLQSLLNLSTSLLSGPLAPGPAQSSLAQSLAGQLLGLRAQLEKLSQAVHPQQAAAAKKASGANRQTAGLPLPQLQELLRQTEGAVHRIQGQQIQAAAEQEAGRLLWSLELPVRHEDRIGLLELRISQEKRQEHGEDALPLVVMLKLDLPHAGPVAARLTLQGEQLGLVMWAEQEDTLAMARGALPELKQRLEDSGLKTNRLSLLHGQPPIGEETMKMDETMPLIDIKA